MSSRHRELRGQLASLSVDGGHGYLSFGIDQQLPDSACEVALEATQGFDSGLALGLLLGEELSRWGMAAALGDGDAVKGAVELTVAAAIEAVADAVARGGGDRGDARQAGELGIAGKAPRAGGLGEELGRSQGAAALQGEQLGSLGFDQGTDLAFELGGPAGAATDLGDRLAGHTHPSALIGGGQRSCRCQRMLHCSSERALTRSSRWSSRSLTCRASSSRWAAGRVSGPSRRAARAMARASIGSDLPALRSARRLSPISFGGTRTTLSPEATRKRSREPET